MRQTTLMSALKDRSRRPPSLGDAHDNAVSSGGAGASDRSLPASRLFADDDEDDIIAHGDSIDDTMQIDGTQTHLNFGPADNTNAAVPSRSLFGEGASTAGNSASAVVPAVTTATATATTAATMKDYFRPRSEGHGSFDIGRRRRNSANTSSSDEDDNDNMVTSPRPPAANNNNTRKRRSGDGQGGRNASVCDNDDEDDDNVDAAARVGAAAHSSASRNLASIFENGAKTGKDSSSNDSIKTSSNITADFPMQQQEQNLLLRQTRPGDSASTMSDNDSSSICSTPPKAVAVNNATATNSSSNITSNGFAPTSGRYSFTASPIDEAEEDIFKGIGLMSNKVRRLNLGPEDASTSASISSSSKKKQRHTAGGGSSSTSSSSTKRNAFRNMKAEQSVLLGGGSGGGSGGGGGLGLNVRTASGKMDSIEEGEEHDDRISPTDVMSFPVTTMTTGAGTGPGIGGNGGGLFDSPPPPETPKSGKRRSGGVREPPSSTTKMMMMMSDENEATEAEDTPVAPGTPKISRSARASGGNKYNNHAPGTPTLEDRIVPKSLSTATSHTPFRGHPPGTPVMEKRAVRRTPRIFTFRDDDNDGVGDGRGSLGGAKRRGRFGDRDEDMDMGGNSASSQARFETDFEVIGHPLGNGSFGTVYKCLSKVDGCTYAIKVANRRIKGVADRERMLKEVYALAALCDKADTAAFHIVRYHQAWMEEGRLYIQTELCSWTLHSEIGAGQFVQYDRRYKLLREILLALELIHKNGMVHLDIKPENIFIKNDQFKLGDFGLVSKVSTNSEVEEGDSRYMSMELLSFGAHGDLTKSDIFSLGATLYEVCLGRPLPANGEEWQDIRRGKLHPMPQTPLPLDAIIREMMNPDPSQRPDATTLLKKRELLSVEQKQLLLEKNKVLEANMALAVHKERMKKLSPPRRNKLVRHNTWNGGF